MGLYEILKNNTFIDKHSMFGCINLHVDTTNEYLSSEEKAKLELVKNVLTLYEEVETTKATFAPALVYYDGERTFGPQDLFESDYNTLKTLDFNELPTTIRAKIADLIWVEKKEYKYAKIAIAAYLELFTMWFSEDDWLIAIKVIDRILCISTQINDCDERNKAYELLWINLRALKGKDDGFLSINIIERCIDGQYGQPEDMIILLDSIIDKHHDNCHKVEKAYALKKKCFEWKKDSESAKQTCLDLARYYADLAYSLNKNTFQAVTMAEKYIVEAVKLYRNNGDSLSAEKLQKELVNIQKVKPQFMASLKTTYDASELHNYIVESFKELSFEEAIVRLTQYTVFKEYESVKLNVIDDLKTSPLAHLFTQSMINEKGQTVVNFPPLDPSNPEKDKTLLDKHIHKKYYDIECIEGDLFLKRALHIIRTNYDFDENDLDFLIMENGMVPKDREKIIRRAIYIGLKGEYYQALHILAPQVENIFRVLAGELGALTVTLDNDGTSQEKLLSSVFDLPELVDGYDENILFIFKGLLNEHAGANIRNKIAHGIMNENGSNSGASVYFLCATIKMLSFTSIKFFDVYENCENIKQLKDPGNRIIPTIIKE